MKSSSSSRRQERSGLTRMRLVRAAEKIFARDGFEAARLEDIAAEAGFTRGAFYANFSSKEDLFLALLEGEISARIDAIESVMQGLRGRGAKIRALREFFLNMAEDRRWSLLSLEFKLFAVRHPDARARLAAMNRRLAGPRIRVLQQLHGSSGKPTSAATAIAMSMSAATNALALEHMLDRSAMPESALKRMLAAYFDTIIGLELRPPNAEPSKI